MALSSTTNRVSYAGNGSTTDFAFSYKFLQNEDLVVVERVVATGVETVKELTTHYTVAGEGEDSGGTVTMLVAPATGTSLVIYRNPDATQPYNPADNESLPAETMEEAHDRMALIAQGIKDLLSRSLKLSKAYLDSFSMELPAILTANAVLTVNADGDAFEMGPTTTEIADAEANAVAAAASAAAALASETAAATSETNAATSETNAAASETAAATSETNAATSETNAATSETNAATSETNAAASETAAQLAETNAELAETNAETAETNAAASAAAALASETAAATSETNAATSETNASNSAAAAAAAASTATDTNDASTGSVIALTTDSLRSIRLTGAVTELVGLDDGADGRIVFVINASGGDIPVRHDGAGASAADRIHTGNDGLDASLKDGAIFMFKYDATDTVWRIIGGAGGGGALVSNFTADDPSIGQGQDVILRYTGGAPLTLTTLTLTSLPFNARLTFIGTSNDNPLTIPESIVGNQNGDIVLHAGQVAKYFNDATLGLIQE